MKSYNPISLENSVAYWIRVFQRNAIEAPIVESYIIHEYVLKIQRYYLFLNSNRILTKKEKKKFYLYAKEN